jgi:hypothetical protein
MYELVSNFVAEFLVNTVFYLDSIFCTLQFNSI